MKPTADQLLASIQSMAPEGFENAGQTVLAEALKTCTSIEQLTKLPVTLKPWMYYSMVAIWALMTGRG